MSDIDDLRREAANIEENARVAFEAAKWLNAQAHDCGIALNPLATVESMAAEMRRRVKAIRAIMAKGRET